MSIRKVISPSREECDRWLRSLRNKTRRAVREANGQGIEGWQHAQEEKRREEEYWEQEEEKHRRDQERREREKREKVKAAISDQNSKAGRLFEAAIDGRETLNGPLTQQDIRWALAEEIGGDENDYVASTNALMDERGARVPLLRGVA